MWGLPMVVSDWRGNRDVSGNSAEYFNVQTTMSDNLALSLKELLHDFADLRKMAECSRQRYVSSYRQERNEYPEFVARLIGTPHKA
jgi:hypothetical protein